MFRHILLPLDGSVFAESAIPGAVELARRFDGKLTLCQIVNYPNLYVGEGTFAPQLYRDLEQQHEQEAQAYLESQKAKCEAMGVTTFIEVVVGNGISDVILQLADQISVDAIVLCSHGSGGLTRLVFGSTAEEVVRHARVPVVLIRPDHLKPHAFDSTLDTAPAPAVVAPPSAD
jgi:nucleotide-binding universal stress UspA family protein